MLLTSLPRIEIALAPTIMATMSATPYSTSVAPDLILPKEVFKLYHLGLSKLEMVLRGMDAKFSTSVDHNATIVRVDVTPDKPTRKLSTKNLDAEKQLEQQGMDIKYQEELKRHLDRKDTLKKGLKRAYALIFSNYCT